MGTSVSVGNWSKKGGTEKIWHQHSYFQSFSLPSSLRTISNQLCVKPNVNRVQSVQHHSKDSVLVGGRSAAIPAQLEPPLPIDALTMLKKDIPACQKHPAEWVGTVWPQGVKEALGVQDGRRFAADSNGNCLLVPSILSSATLACPNPIATRG